MFIHLDRVDIIQKVWWLSREVQVLTYKYLEAQIFY